MKVVFTVILLLLHVIAVSQDVMPDSISNSLRNKNQTEQIELLHELVKNSWTSDPQQAKMYGKAAVEKSSQLGNDRLLSISYRLYGGVYNYLSQIDSGRYFKAQALAIALELRDSALLAPTYNNLGVTAQTIGNHIEALEYFYKAFLIGRKIEARYVPTIMANISEVYYDLKKFDSAIYYAQEAVDRTSYDPYTSRHLLPKIWLARAQIASNNFEEAKVALQSIIEIGDKIGEKRYTAYGYQELGMLSLKTEESDIALNYLRKAGQLFHDLEDQAYVGEVFQNFSEVYVGLDLDSAYLYAHKSLRIAKELDLNELLFSNYETLIKIYQFQESSDSINFYRSARSQLENDKIVKYNEQNIRGVFSKIQEEKIKEQLVQQSLELEKQKYGLYFLITFILFMIIFSIYIFINYQKQKKLSDSLAQVHAEVSAQNEMIEGKNHDLEQLNKEKNELIKIVAHDLKNPLSNILGSIQLIEGAEPEDVKTFHRIIEESAIRLSEMITKILNVETIENNNPSVEVIRLNFSQLLFSFAEEFEFQALKKEISIIRSIDEDIFIEVDPTYINQVIENLLSNAIKFSPYRKNIFINLKSTDEQVEFSVRDEGPGLSIDDQKNLFKMYTTLTPKPTGDETSSGIGLATVKKFVEKMNGCITCESTLGQGTTFTLLLQKA